MNSHTHPQSLQTNSSHRSRLIDRHLHLRIYRRLHLQIYRRLHLQIFTFLPQKWRARKELHRSLDRTGHKGETKPSTEGDHFNFLLFGDIVAGLFFYCPLRTYAILALLATNTPQK